MLLENTLTNWSATKLDHYNECPYRVYLKYIKRVPEPPPNPKYEVKRQRGILFHDNLRDCINDGAPVPRELMDFEEIIDGYRALGAVAEVDEFFDKQWKPHPQWQGHWLVVKKDVRILVPGEFVLIADWKTGKKHGNEYKHYRQMQLYAVSEYVLDPGFPEYTVELQYLDQKDTWQHTFKPHELEKAWRDFDREANVMFNDRMFRPRPSIVVCRYCPFNSKNGSGACAVAAL